jgi:hypothetical protein
MLTAAELGNVRSSLLAARGGWDGQNLCGIKLLSFASHQARTRCCCLAVARWRDMIPMNPNHETT